jgi:hypothetical protein
MGCLASCDAQPKSAAEIGAMLGAALAFLPGRSACEASKALLDARCSLLDARCSMLRCRRKAADCWGRARSTSSSQGDRSRPTLRRPEWQHVRARKRTASHSTDARKSQDPLPPFADEARSAFHLRASARQSQVATLSGHVESHLAPPVNQVHPSRLSQGGRAETCRLG